MQQILHRKLEILFCLFIIPLLVTGCTNSNSSAASLETGVVIEASVTDTVESSGAVAAKQLVTLSWDTNGIVESVKVQNNDSVVSGEELMSLDSKSAPSTVIEAISTLIDAKQNLADIQVSNADLAEAEVALVEAQAAFDEAQIEYWGLDDPVGAEEYIAILETDYLNAQKTAARALFTYNKYLDYEETSTVRANATSALAQARIDEHDAMIRLNHFSNPPDEITAGYIKSNYALTKANLAEAQKNYDEIKGGNQEAINQAQAAVNAAQATVNKLGIIAPIDGQVAMVYAQPGDTVSTGTTAVVLYDRSTLVIDAMVAEDVISKVKVGNPVAITFSGLDIETTGKVTLIDPIGVSSSGVVNYSVRIELDETDPQIYIGATATVVITTSDPQNKLYVPVTSVLNDVEGEYVLRVSSDGTTERINVITSDISDEKVVVTGDLSKGDLVQVFTSSSTTTTTTDQNRGGLFGGMGGLLR